MHLLRYAYSHATLGKNGSIFPKWQKQPYLKGKVHKMEVNDYPMNLPWLLVC